MNATQFIGRRTLSFDVLDSTNVYALSLANNPDKDGLVVLAAEQTAGRGQYGRTWTAPPGSSVLMSVLLFPPPELCRPAILTAWAAAAVCRLVKQITKLEPRIKWPNDVLVNGRKVCGILIEQRTLDAARVATVVGIGLNVTQPAGWFTEAGLTEAGSLVMFADGEFDRHRLVELLVTELDSSYAELRQGSLETLESYWRERLDLVGKDIVIEAVNRSYAGSLKEMSFAGLDLESAEGRLHLPPESIKHIFQSP